MTKEEIKAELGAAPSIVDYVVSTILATRAALASVEGAQDTFDAERAKYLNRSRETTSPA